MASSTVRALVGGLGLLSLAAVLPAWAKPVPFDIPSQEAVKAIPEFARQAGIQILVPTDQLKGVKTPAIHGTFELRDALRMLLAGTGITIALDDGQTIALSASQNATAQAAKAPETEARAKQTQSADDERNVERVVVTGTNIRGRAPVGSPLERYTQEDIRNSGATTTEQFLQRLPQNANSLSGFAPRANNQFDPENVSGVDLRGLGIGTTLVLINGRRPALASSGRAVDISLIPLGAIKRIDIMADGASAIYGSDAVGGVVNFVLRSDFDGAETAVEYGAATRGGFSQTRVEQTIGTNWESGNALASYTYFDRSELNASERDFSAPAAPYTLVPPDVRHNLLASVRQDTAGGVRLSADGLFSKRESSYRIARFFSGNSIDTGKSEEQQYLASFGAEKDVLGGVASLAVSYADLESGSDLTSGQRNDWSDSILDITAKLDGSLFNTWAGSVLYSIGAGYTSEDYALDVALSGVPFSSNNVGRQTRYAFGEVVVPLVSEDNRLPIAQRLDISLATRYTDHSDFGEAESSKVGVLWSPVEGLNLRGSYSQSFRAPFLSQLTQNSASFSLFPLGLIGFPDPFSNNGSSILLFLSGSSPNLRAETADTYSLGLDANPEIAPDLRFSATYVHIQYRDKILSPTNSFLPSLLDPVGYRSILMPGLSAAELSQLISNATVSLNLTPLNPSDPNALAAGIAAVFDDRLRNLALSELDAIDLSLNYHWEESFGELRVGAQLSYILDFDQQVAEGSPIESGVDLPLRPADLKSRAFVGWSAGPWSSQLNVNYVDNYDNPVSPARDDVDSWTTIDLSLAYEFETDSSLSGLTLSVSAQNLFDEDPPYLPVGVTPADTISSPIGFDPANANPLGRFISLQARMGW